MMVFIVFVAQCVFVGRTTIYNAGRGIFLFLIKDNTDNIETDKN